MPGAEEEWEGLTSEQKDKVPSGPKGSWKTGSVIDQSAVCQTLWRPCREASSSQICKCKICILYSRPSVSKPYFLVTPSPSAHLPVYPLLNLLPCLSPLLAPLLWVHPSLLSSPDYLEDATLSPDPLAPTAHVMHSLSFLSLC